MVAIRTRYDVCVESAGFDNSDEPSMTQQAFKDDCDINNIIRSYDASGVYIRPQESDGTRQPMFGDFTQMPADMQTAYNLMLDARANFDQLDVSIRERFNYDPSKFLGFVQDPKNRDECVQLGLLAPIPTPEPVSAEYSSTPESAPVSE